LSLQFVRFATILLVAFTTGLAFAHLLGAPERVAYPASFYIAVQKSMYAGWGLPKIGLFLEPIAILASGVLAFLVRKQRLAFRSALGAMFALLLAFPVVFFLLLAPANAVFHAATAENIPPNWAAFRASWEFGNALRCGLQLAALGSLVLSLTFYAGKSEVKKLGSSADLTSTDRIPAPGEIRRKRIRWEIKATR